ncbi:MAG: UDP-glucose/GDP-mannose dehydrogenase family protein [Candidatus Peribacter sp.]|jgi:UDPglucose 6-dehydrogenase|nr:UDP-glucose/GDP-mannose dehydrogenase family protein [Candidatus Peribacter sp.]MBT4393195.1 UDP-glucose/GDP-mannose dehydrogenase family protein [Candidatus Peribacter sp.]MBT4600461.1 UDP-glucose/GDP-mannose dehydrogenase family protein [Candidatus Peribacter sp.]MBT5148563.1 UDP-glucose/GDP-mannose dehydrogenase family protein [Candidatus Peribacter sp.]MBT5638729.1 UDP-glucose/GDP-mannose dehydrogenase family protein [Candidatus Peribacter sp.]
MKIAVIGTGYVGLVSAVCFAELGHDVYGVDIDEEKVAKLREGISPIYEPELEDLLKRNLEAGRVKFTTNLEEALPDTQVVFSAVATPPNEDFSADLKAVFIVAQSVAKYADHDIVFVNKSTVPVSTGEKCAEVIAKTLKDRGVDYNIPVVSNPEFLREGHAINDTMAPDRIVVGINGSDWAKKVMEELYVPLTRTSKPIVWMSRESSEIVKYASNGFLANKISFANMLSELCEATGGNVRDVTKGMGMDDRIGPRFLHSGIGYGGSCFPKDVKALIALSRETGVPLPLIQATHDINQHQRERYFKKILDVLPANATVGLLGLSFKPRTDDMREAPSLDLIPLLVKAGHTVRVHDPIAMDNAKTIVKEDVEWKDDAFSTAENADAVVVLTEWDEFRGLDLNKLKLTMKGSDLFDGRNIYEPDDARKAGLTYHGIGL